jgi:hypothetical protein
MNPFFTPLGGMFLFLALFYLFGLLNPFARRFYPDSPGVLRRSAAPVIFACLAMACFRGFGLPALLLVAIAGMIQIAAARRNRRKPGSDPAL